MLPDVLFGPDAAPFAPLRERRVAIVGYGNQGRAHALNLRDSGATIVVGARPGGPGAAAAIRDGFRPLEPAAAAAAGDLVVIALPDEAQPAAWSAWLAASVAPGATIGFLHGLAIHRGWIDPPEGIGVVLVAPKGPGTTLRERFERGLGLPCLLAIHREARDGGAEALALAWAAGIGAARAAIVRTTFADETETDLFGEQAVLCGGMTALIEAAFETLVAAGYPEELAYLECCHEVKQVADLVYERGLAGMMAAISNAAEFGAHRAGPRIVDAALRERLAALLADVRSGAFAEALRADAEAGFPELNAERARLAGHRIERAGRRVRDWMGPPAEPTKDEPAAAPPPETP